MRSSSHLNINDWWHFFPNLRPDTHRVQILDMEGLRLLISTCHHMSSRVAGDGCASELASGAQRTLMKRIYTNRLGIVMVSKHNRNAQGWKNKVNTCA